MKNIRVLTAVAMLSAMSIILGKYLAFPIGNILRFSFENLPVILAGIAFGPIVGAITGVVADLVGCVLVGYAINPVVTLGAAIIGFTAGAVYKLTKSVSLLPRITLCVLIAHLLGSVVIKTVGLAVFYSMPVYMLMLWRVLNYLIVGLAELALVYFIMKNRSVQATWLFDGRREDKK